MIKLVCPQKWTVKVMGTYLTYTITLIWKISTLICFDSHD